MYRNDRDNYPIKNVLTKDPIYKYGRFIGQKETPALAGSFCGLAAPTVRRVRYFRHSVYVSR